MDYLPITANGLEKLIQGVNNENGTSFAVDNFSYSLPVPLTNNTIANTGITLTASDSTPYYGNFAIQYNRLDVSKFGQNGIVYGELTKPTIYEAMSELRELFSADLSEDDVEDGPITSTDPTSPETQKTLTLTAKPNSVLFIGSSVLTVRVSRSFPVYEDGVARTYFVYSEASDIADVPVMMKSFYSDYSENLNFKFLRNITNIKNFTVESVNRLANGSFLFHGFFQFDWTKAGTVLANLSTTCFKMDEFGGVTDVYSAYVYPFISLLSDGSDTLFEEKDGIAFKMLRSSTFVGVNGTKPAGLYKFVDGEASDSASYVPVITYSPDVIRLNKEGKLYTVSPAYTGSDPTNGGRQAKLRRIDRLLSNGQLDPDFTTIYLSVDTYNMYPVLDIQETTSGNFFVVLNPELTCDVAFSNPYVNNLLLADSENAGTTISWNPVIKFKANGQQDLTFSTTLGTMFHAAVCESYTTIKEKDVKCLIPQGERAGFLSYKQSPTTGFKYQIPMFFNEYGTPIFKNNFADLGFIKWLKIENLIVQSNGGFVIAGDMQLMKQEAQGTVFSAPRHGFAFFDQDGSAIKVFTHVLPVKNVWMTEQ